MKWTINAIVSRAIDDYSNVDEEADEADESNDNIDSRADDDSDEGDPESVPHSPYVVKEWSMTIDVFDALKDRLPAFRDGYKLKYELDNGYIIVRTIPADVHAAA